MKETIIREDVLQKSDLTVVEGFEKADSQRLVSIDRHLRLLSDTK
jgi:hypothetical protein